MRYEVKKIFSATKVFDAENCVATFSGDDNGQAAFRAFLIGCAILKIEVYDHDRGEYMTGTLAQLTGDAA